MDQIELKRLLRFDPQSGEFRWKVDRGGGAKAGDIAGGSNSCGYWKIWVCGRSYYAHRLAWLYVHGRWPAFEIDHIDGNGMNNALDNLREASSGENKENRRRVRSDKKSKGRIGVRWVKEKGKWASRIQRHGKSRHLGYFDTEGDAYQAYLVAKERMHPFQTLTSRGEGLA